LGRNTLAGPKGYEALITSLVAGQEYFIKAGGTQAQWLDRAVIDLYGRPRGPHEFDPLLGQSRSSAVTFLINQLEYRGIVVDTAFQQFLKRPTSGTPERNTYIQMLGDPKKNGYFDLVTTLLSSQEYYE